MKPFNFVVTTGETVPHALQLLKEEIDKSYMNMACQIQQLILLPQAIPITTVAATPNGQPQIKLVYNLVAIIVEEPELDNLQRNFKNVFDFVNNNAADLGNILIGYLATVADCITPTMKERINQIKQNQQHDIPPNNTAMG